MRNMLCEEYTYSPITVKRRHHVEPKDYIDDGVTEAIEKFIKKHGYKPVLMTARQEELNFMHVRSDIEVHAESICPWTIRLYEVVRRRTPVMLDEKRKAI